MAKETPEEKTAREAREKEAAGGGKPAESQTPAEIDLNDPKVTKAITDAVAAAKAEAKTEFENAAATAKAEEDGEFKTLYETEKAAHEVTKTALADLTTEAETLRGIVDAEIEAKSTALPDSLKKLMPDYEDRGKKLKWLSDAMAEHQEENDKGGNNPDPKGKDGKPPTADEALEKTKAVVQRTGGYRM